MDQAPLVTVIIPSYNSPDLFMTLESVIQQDYPRIQPVLVDDGTKGFSREAAEDYLRQNQRGNLEHIRVLANPENRGTVYTMNRALKESLGAYIFNLAGDDCFYDGHVLSDWVAAFRETGAQVMTAYRCIYDAALEKLISREPQPKQVRSLQTRSTRELFEELGKTNYVFGSCTARTAESFRKYGLYDEGYRLIEDHPTVLKLLRLGEPIVFFDRTVVKCRTGGSSCAANYNPDYARDVDRILQVELLPYTKHPVAMKWAFFQWKREQRILRKRQRLLTRAGNRRLSILLVGLWYYMHHPIRILCKLPEKLSAKKGE